MTLKKPCLWQVVYSQPKGVISDRPVPVISEAFNLSGNEAFEIIVKAAASGKFVMRSGLTHELANQKVMEANRLAERHRVGGTSQSGLCFYQIEQP